MMWHRLSLWMATSSLLAVAAAPIKCPAPAVKASQQVQEAPVSPFAPTQTIPIAAPTVVPTPTPTPVPVPIPVVRPAEQAGRIAAISLVESYAQSWDNAASYLDQGASVEKAEREQDFTWHAARTSLWLNEIQPAFLKMVPAEAFYAKPTSDPIPSRVIAVWKDFAKGLRDGAKRNPQVP